MKQQQIVKQPSKPAPRPTGAPDVYVSPSGKPQKL
jgi:hypothetical protein